MTEDEKFQEWLDTQAVTDPFLEAMAFDSIFWDIVKSEEW